MSQKNIAIVAWKNNKDDFKWIQWYEDIKALSNNIGLPITHMGITSAKFTSGKIVTVNRMEKKMLDSIKSGDSLVSLSCLSLPKDYSIASFDYNAYFISNKAYIAAILKEEFYNPDLEKEILSMLNKCVEYDDGAIFSTSVEEVPLLYIATKDRKNLSTYELLKKIER